VWETARSEDPFAEVEVALLSGSGEQRIARMYAFRLSTDEEGRELLDCFVEDITERRRMEEDKAQLEQQIYHAQRLQSMGQMAGGIAHDFNNYLAAIMGSAEVLRLRLDMEEATQKRLDDISSPSPGRTS
jgi:C4-dicarboxylate-specific signal transduction histidine kinase